jgi:hypothetical protein
MAKADRVLSTPPTNTSATTPKSSRRGFLVQAAGVAAGGAAIGAGLPLPAAHTLDAELIELGARFEPLVDRYYAVRAIWAQAMTRSHSEQDREFGTWEDRDYQDTPEIRAAWEEACERNGLRDASARLSAMHKEMKPLENVINAARVTSIEGLRAKALVALYEVAPLCAEETEFSFDDAWPFQQLFTAVAELCGLKDKMAATGYALPDIGMVEAAPDDDADDDGEDA